MQTDKGKTAGRRLHQGTGNAGGGMGGWVFDHLMLVISRSRSNSADANRPPRRMRMSRAAPLARATLRVAGITLKAMSDVTATAGRLARMASCPAVRGSLHRAEMAMPTQIDQVARSGVKTSWASRSGPRMSAGATPGRGEQLDHGHEQGEDCVGDGDGRDEGG